jgi:chorismate synthase
MLQFLRIQSGSAWCGFSPAGESHGRALVGILEGIPAGLPIDIDRVTRDLKRRQGGYGRGRRMTIESDRADIISGVRAGETIGGPIAMLIENRDWVNWQRTMYTGARAGAGRNGRQPRPGQQAFACDQHAGVPLQLRMSTRARQRACTAGAFPLCSGAGARFGALCRAGSDRRLAALKHLGRRSARRV